MGVNKELIRAYVEVWRIRWEELYAVILQQLLIDHLGHVLLGIVHHVDVVLIGPLVHEPLGLVRSQLSLELLLGRFRLVMASIVSFHALLGPQAVRQVRHEPQEVGALDALVEDQPLFVMPATRVVFWIFMGTSLVGYLPISPQA